MRLEFLWWLLRFRTRDKQFGEFNATIWRNPILRNRGCVPHCSRTLFIHEFSILDEIVIWKMDQWKCRWFQDSLFHLHLHSFEYRIGNSCPNKDFDFNHMQRLSNSATCPLHFEEQVKTRTEPQNDASFGFHNGGVKLYFDGLDDRKTDRGPHENAPNLNWNSRILWANAKKSMRAYGKSTFSSVIWITVVLRAIFGHEWIHHRPDIWYEYMYVRIKCIEKYIFYGVLLWNTYWITVSNDCLMTVRLMISLCGRVQIKWRNKNVCERDGTIYSSFFLRI